MADRIERYLGKLEAELHGRVEADRLEEILVEVEGHLRESEEAYRELGEPDELAEKYALDGFGEVVVTQTREVPTGIRGLGLAMLFGCIWVGLVVLFVVPKMNSQFLFAYYPCLAFGAGFFLYRYWKVLLRGVGLGAAVAFLVGTVFFGGSWSGYQGKLEIQRLVASENQMRVEGRSLAFARQNLDELTAARVAGQSSPTLNHRIMKVESMIATTLEIQQSRWVDRLAPIGYAVALYGVLGAGYFAVFAVCGWLVRRGVESVRRVVRVSHG